MIAGITGSSWKMGGKWKMENLLCNLTWKRAYLYVHNQLCFRYNLGHVVDIYFHYNLSIIVYIVWHFQNKSASTQQCLYLVLWCSDVVLMVAAGEGWVEAGQGWAGLGHDEPGLTIPASSITQPAVISCEAAARPPPSPWVPTSRHSLIMPIWYR